MINFQICVAASFFMYYDVLSAFLFSVSFFEYNNHFPCYGSRLMRKSSHINKKIMVNFCMSLLRFFRTFFMVNYPVNQVGREELKGVTDRATFFYQFQCLHEVISFQYFIMQKIKFKSFKFKCS